MPQISKFPRGFLSLVGMNNRGENPREVTDQIVPVVDIGANFLIETQELLFTVNSGAANGFNRFDFNPVTGLVPAGETWRLWLASLSITTPAGCTGRVSLALRTSVGGGGRSPIAAPLNFIASETNWQVVAFDTLWLPAGWEIGFELAALVGVPSAVSGQFLISRLRA